MKAIKSIQPQFQKQIDNITDRLLSDFNKIESDIDFDGIKGYVTDTVRGHAYNDGRFTVPVWAYKSKKEGYFNYYVAHELAHQLRYKKYETDGVHDFKFYSIFIVICPKDLQHYELEYKKTASKYGII